MAKSGESVISEYILYTKDQWSTESQNIRPKQKISTIRLSALAAEVLF